MPWQGYSVFDWDEGNIRKVSERMHCSIAELAFRGRPYVKYDARHSNGEKRWLLINQVANRFVCVAFTTRNQKIRIISARFMHQKEVKQYENWFKR